MHIKKNKNKKEALSVWLFWEKLQLGPGWWVWDGGADDAGPVAASLLWPRTSLSDLDGGILGALNKCGSAAKPLSAGLKWRTRPLSNGRRGNSTSPAYWNMSDSVRVSGRCANIPSVQLREGRGLRTRCSQEPKLSQWEGLWVLLLPPLGLGMVFCASQVALVVKNQPANAGDVRDAGLIPRLERFPGEGNGNPFQYSCLENPMDRKASRATVHRVAKSQIWLKRPCMHAHTAQGSCLTPLSWVGLWPPLLWCLSCRCGRMQLSANLQEQLAGNCCPAGGLYFGWCVSFSEVSSPSLWYPEKEGFLAPRRLGCRFLPPGEVGDVPASESL